MVNGVSGCSDAQDEDARARVLVLSEEGPTRLHHTPSGPGGPAAGSAVWPQPAYHSALCACAAAGPRACSEMSGGHAVRMRSPVPSHLAGKGGDGWGWTAGRLGREGRCVLPEVLSRREARVWGTCTGTLSGAQQARSTEVTAPEPAAFGSFC